jgi:hypothetical protein
MESLSGTLDKILWGLDLGENSGRFLYPTFGVLEMHRDVRAENR